MKESHLATHSQRSHLAPFTEGLRPWLVLARNAVPVIGVSYLDWSAEATLAEIWFDGITALGAMLAFQVWAFARKGGPPFEAPPGVPQRTLPLVLALVWMVLTLLLGIPYWFLLPFLLLKILNGGFPWSILQDPWVVAAFIFVLVSNIVEQSKRGYGRMNDAELRLEFNWEFNMHLARICAIIPIIFFMSWGIVTVLAVALSYVEIYPMRALRFFGGDSTLDAENINRSRD